MELCLLELENLLRASEIFVPLPDASVVRSSRTIYRACSFPFLGGMYFSILSENNTAPVLSLLLTAEKARTAAIWVTISFLVWLVPNKEEALMSIRKKTVNSLSSSNTLLKG